MSQNVTVSSVISPTQSIAVAALVGGATITTAAEQAGVARETVSRWMHHNPFFITELQNSRAEIASQTRLALEKLGMQAIAVLSDALQNQTMLPSRLRAACAVLKLLGADRAETIPLTTVNDVAIQLGERTVDSRERRSNLSDRGVNIPWEYEEQEDEPPAAAPPPAVDPAVLARAIAAIEEEEAEELLEEATAARPTAPQSAAMPAAGNTPAPLPTKLDEEDFFDEIIRREKSRLKQLTQASHRKDRTRRRRAAG